MSFDAAIYATPKIDCHCHILDPGRFAYGADVPYRAPLFQTKGTPALLSDQSSIPNPTRLV